MIQIFQPVIPGHLGAPEEFKYFIHEFIYLKNSIFSRISMLQHVIVIYASILHVADQVKILNCDFWIPRRYLKYI